MNRQADFVRRQREAAGAFGRELRDGLLSDYCSRYGVEFPPPPALIIDELLTDFLNVRLLFDPLPRDIFAKTEYLAGQLTVTVNSLTRTIPGVVDAQGVENTGKWHEAIHVVRNAAHLKIGPQTTLPGVDPPLSIACYRGGNPSWTSEAREREFWAEEAGRAAAVSYAHLARSTSFRRLLSLSDRTPVNAAQSWGFLYQAAADIAVNRTALVKQLQYDGLIVVTSENGRRRLHVQPGLRKLAVSA